MKMQVITGRRSTANNVPVVRLLFSILLCSNMIHAFLPMSPPRALPTLLRSSSAPSDVDDTPTEHIDFNMAERGELKLKLLGLCASYDRGFGASPKARKDVDDLIEKLELMNPTPINAAKGIDGAFKITDEGRDKPPLQGNWRMIWTTALDVLSLDASPFVSPGAIYQIIEPPIATNIIDLIPRAQTLFPTVFPSSLIRAEVKTRASLRPNMSNRVGLDFESVKLKPVQLLGVDSRSISPLNFNLPRIPIKTEDLPGVDQSTAPGFFDVSYLDDDMLIIKQNAPGGYFVSLKVADYDP